MFDDKWIYRFSSLEIEKCQDWSSDIEKRKGDWDYTRRYRHGGKFQTHFQSKKAVIACSHYTGLNINWDIQDKGDDGIDLSFFKSDDDLDCTIDVKYAGVKWYGMKTNTSNLSDFHADIGILVTPEGIENEDCPHVIRGVIMRERFRNIAEENNFGFGKRWVVEQENLSDFSKMLYFMKNHGVVLPAPTLELL